MKTIAGSLLLVVLAVALLWERSALNNLRAENAALVGLKEEATRLAEENRALPELRAADAPTPATDIDELTKLRAEIRRGQNRSAEIARLKSDNARLAAELASGAIKPRRLADLPGFLPRAQWVQNTFATPEQAAQSFFSAMASGDLEQYVRCFGLKEAEKLRAEMAKDPEGARRAFARDSPVTGATGIVIASQKVVAEDAVVVSVQLSADGDTFPLPLRRVNGEWKIDDTVEAP